MLILSNTLTNAVCMCKDGHKLIKLQTNSIVMQLLPLSLWKAVKLGFEISASEKRLTVHVRTSASEDLLGIFFGQILWMFLILQLRMLTPSMNHIGLG